MKLRELLQQLQSVQQSIEVAPAFICGGVCRDRYMENLSNISDIDITNGEKTIDYLSQEFANELKKKYNITRKIMTDHSSIFIGSLKMDFSSNFNTPNIDVILKKQGINNPTGMERELYSRDFSCNALLMSLDLKTITDPTNKGFQDIKDKKIRTCLAPEITLTANRNRVIRSIYLACKLGFDIDESIISFVKKNPQSVKISTEKSLSEKLNEAFTRDGDKASHLLTKMGIWNYIPITEIVHPYYIKNIKKSL